MNTSTYTPSKEGIRKGSIWNIERGTTGSTGTEIWAGRPGIIVSNEATNQKAGFVNVVYLTTAPKRSMPSHIPVISDGKNATAMCEQIFAVDKSRLTSYIGQITAEEMLNIDKALLFSLGISNTIRPTSIFTKWIQAVERYGVDLSSNPIMEDDRTDLVKERDMYKRLYENERTNVENLLHMA